MQLTRESIFTASIRSFCATFCTVLGLLCSLAVAGLFLFLLVSPGRYPEKAEVVLMPDAEGKRDLVRADAPVILRIDLHGLIGEGALTGEKFQSLLVDSREDTLKNNRVKAVLLHVNTPGGTVVDSDAIYRALIEYKKKYEVPVYAYIDGMCASGGMYISAAADRIYASTSSVIGSIGVRLGPAFNFSQAMQKIGVQSLTLTEGKNKDMLNPFRPWQEGEEESLRHVLSATYDRFIEVVTTNRPRVAKEKLLQEYGAQIFIAKDAEAIGYIDVDSADYKTALQDLLQKASIQEPYQVVQLRAPHPFLQDLSKAHLLLQGKITHTLSFEEPLPKELKGKLLYLYQTEASK